MTNITTILICFITLVPVFILLYWQNRNTKKEFKNTIYEEFIPCDNFDCIRFFSTVTRLVIGDKYVGKVNLADGDLVDSFLVCSQCNRFKKSDKFKVKCEPKEKT